MTWSGPPSAPKITTDKANGLLLRNVQFEDSGQYTCRVSNKLGSVEVQTILVIQNVGKHFKLCVVIVANCHNSLTIYI